MHYYKSGIISETIPDEDFANVSGIAERLNPGQLLDAGANSAYPM